MTVLHEDQIPMQHISTVPFKYKSEGREELDGIAKCVNNVPLWSVFCSY